MIKEMFTINSFQKYKIIGKKITMLTAYDYTFARNFDLGGIDTILVGDSLGMVMMGNENTLAVTMNDMVHHTRCVTKGVEKAFVIADMPFMSYHINKEKSVQNAGRLIKEGGADGVKIEGGKEIVPVVKSLVNAKIPVVGHMGLTPQSINAFGGFKVQGKNELEAERILKEAFLLEKSGICALVLECVPESLAKRISEELKIPTIGIGAGRYCDGQVLVGQDMLGLFSDFQPKFVKRFVNGSEVVQEAVRSFKKAVEENKFPKPKHAFYTEEEKHSGKIFSENMEVFCRPRTLQIYLKKEKKMGKTIGFVPTMGALHKGHVSLIEKAKSENDLVVVSIFVNPLQFGPGEDLQSYPRAFEEDKALMEKLGVDCVFFPKEEDMYPAGDKILVSTKGKLTDGLCGSQRPDHFQGVLTVVSKLFHICVPNRAYFGLKDAQQLALIKRLVCDMHFDIDIVACPIVREQDGLAVSSRNEYLDSEKRKQATVLYKSLIKAIDLLNDGEREKKVLEKAMRLILTEASFAKIDYIEFVNPLTMEPIDILSGKALVAIAVYIGKTRLIDNMLWEDKSCM